MKEKIETIVVGGGQAGLATSYFLNKLDHEHIVLEKSDQPGNAWRNHRWDSFTLVTPNWSFKLPGAEYNGNDPNGFMQKQEIVDRFENHVDRYNLPVRYGVEVTSVKPKGEDSRYLVESGENIFESKNVVMATGMYQKSKKPECSMDIAVDIHQITSDQYRNPNILPEGGVLVVGSGQSGCQIAEELNKAGRKVWLSVGSTGRLPRRYRGKDIYELIDKIGILDRSADQLPSLEQRFASNPHMSGKEGGHTINLHQFAREGIRLSGYLKNASGYHVSFALDLKERLKRVDQFEADIVKAIDGFIKQTGLNLPEEKLPDLRDGYDQKEITRLNLKKEGITNIIWAIGYHYYFNIVKFPVFESNGYPLQSKGATKYPGLYFLGLPFISKQKSGLIYGVGEDAEYIASKICS